MAVNHLLADAIAQAGLSNKRLEALCARHGITRPIIQRYVDGKGRPAPWLAKQIAATLAQDVDVLFPRRGEDQWS